MSPRKRETRFFALGALVVQREPVASTFLMRVVDVERQRAPHATFVGTERLHGDRVICENWNSEMFEIIGMPTSRIDVARDELIAKVSALDAESISLNDLPQVLGAIIQARDRLVEAIGPQP